MNTLREAAQQALEALENSRPIGNDDDFAGLMRLHNKAITALRTALAEPAQPVAWQINDGTRTYVTDRPVDADEAAAEGWTRTPLYTAPPQRKPLTDDAIVDIWAGVSTGYDDQINIIELARAIEAAHGIGDGNG